MSLFDPAHVFHLHMMAIWEQYKINSGEASEPTFAERESVLVGTLINIASDGLSKAAMRSRAADALELWAYKMSPELRERLGLPREET
jgi:hypothetical protein